MSGILCLKWNNHTSTFIKTLDNLRSKELYCDATIACNGRYFPVHRFVLTTCSEYFEDIFERTHCKHPFVIIKDIEELHLESLLNYMYNGEVNVLQDRLPGLIRAAEALKIRGLAICEERNSPVSSDAKTPTKEKKKSIQSSPSIPKIKRNGDKSQTLKDCEGIDDGDIVSESSRPNTNQENVFSLVGNDSQNGGNQFSKNEISQRNEEENDPMDIETKRESTLIVETIKEESLSFSSLTPPDRGEEDKEGSLFISLLSPNNDNSSEDESSPLHEESSSHAIPQCSSWADDGGGGSKSDDEMSVLDVKPLVTFQEGRSDDPGVVLFQKAFSQNTIHEALVMYDSSHRCPMCNFITKTKSELLRHVSCTHSDFRFSCPVCHYKCRTNSLLKKHMLKHTLEKPYSCTLCSYKTARKQHLVRHMKLHTGEKPYSCFFCSYKASRKDRLREHVRKHKQHINEDAISTEHLLSGIGGSGTVPLRTSSSKNASIVKSEPAELEN